MSEITEAKKTAIEKIGNHLRKAQQIAWDNKNQLGGSMLADSLTSIINRFVTQASPVRERKVSARKRAVSFTGKSFDVKKNNLETVAKVAENDLSEKGIDELKVLANDAGIKTKGLTKQQIINKLRLTPEVIPAKNEDDYEFLTLEKLIELAKSMNITYTGEPSRADLIELISLQKEIEQQELEPKKETVAKVDYKAMSFEDLKETAKKYKIEFEETITQEELLEKVEEELSEDDLTI